MSKKMKRNMIAVFAGFMALVLVVVTALNIKGDLASRQLLEESVRSQLLSIAAAAREIIDVDAFVGYNSIEDTQDDENYTRQREELSALAVNVGAKYIYAFKLIDGQAYFVFDTDPITDTRFTSYELDPVHKDAFNGKSSAGIMNSDDEFGAFNSGAIPLYRGG